MTTEPENKSTPISLTPTPTPPSPATTPPPTPPPSPEPSPRASQAGMFATTVEEDHDPEQIYGYFGRF